ncbi:MAG TPA: VWA domain-containing protein [Bryobacteraceae bacterium]|nr:VWA domain-containing protein [Bryobacteraceae bacterium]
MLFRAAALSLLLFPIAAQEPSTSFRVDSSLVVIPVSVTDKTNRYVLGLDKDNFQIIEDGTKQTISHFSSEDAPLSIGLIVDISGSIGSELETSRRAASEFLKTLNKGDEVFLVECSDQAQVAIHFTHDAAEINSKLKTATTGGLTALLDAVRLGIDEMKTAQNPRKALLVISDGGDNNSRYTSQQVEDLVRQADVQIFAMGVFEPFTFGHAGAAELSGPRLLSEISEQTGGRALAASGSQDLPGLASRIGLELRNQYVLAYSPANKERDGKFRHVQVMLKAPEALPELKARWRTGYFAPGQ